MCLLAYRLIALISIRALAETPYIYYQYKCPASERGESKYVGINFYGG